MSQVRGCFQWPIISSVIEPSDLKSAFRFIEMFELVGGFIIPVANYEAAGICSAYQELAEVAAIAEFRLEQSLDGVTHRARPR